jgi:hypothetical protein
MELKEYRLLVIFRSVKQLNIANGHDIRLLIVTHSIVVYYLYLYIRCFHLNLSSCLKILLLIADCVVMSVFILCIIKVPSSFIVT